MPRRRFLLGLGLGVMAATLAATGWAKPTWMRRAVVQELIGDLKGVRAIGARYLALAPEERDAARLARLLFAGIAEARRPFAGVDALRRAIGAHRERDFAAGDTVLVDGWILARTEARLCALVFLG
jgi:hypothetical protein